MLECLKNYDYLLQCFTRSDHAKRHEMRHPEAKAAKEALIQQQVAGKGPPGGIKEDLSGTKRERPW